MRTSWNVGLATAALEPQPLATPRTKVVLPAPSSPFSRTRSPLRRRRPRSSPAASVSAAAEVSREVVVATKPEVQLAAVGARDANRWISRHHSDRSHTRMNDLVFRSDTHQLNLLPTRQRILDRRAGGNRHVCGPDDTAHARHGCIFLHLPDQPVRDVAAAQLSLVEKHAFLQLRIRQEDAALTQGECGRAE